MRGGGRGESGGAVTGTVFIKRNRKFAALKFPKIGPIVLLVKVVRWQGSYWNVK
jgi:hypothetical protein